LKNGFYNSVGGIVRLVVALALVPVLIRIIGPTQYGIWSLAFAIVAVSAVTEIGLSSVVTVFSSRDLVHDGGNALSETLTISLFASIALAIVAALVLWFGAETIASAFSKIPENERALVAKALRIGAILVIARMPQQVFVGIQQAFQRFGVLNAILTVQSVALGIAMVLVAVNGGGIISFMIVQTSVALGAMIAHGIASCRLLHQKHLQLNWSTNKGRQMLHFGVLSTISNLGGVLFTQCDRLIVAAFLDAPTLGVYAAITSITTQINAISALPVQPLLARVSHQWINKRPTPDTHQEIQHALQFNAVLAFGVGTAIFVLAPLIARIVFHGNFNEITVAGLRYASVIYSLYSLNATGYFILPAIGAMTQHTLIQVFGGALSLLLIWQGALHFGLIGAVTGNAGFITTLLLTSLALTRVGISVSQSIKWLSVPLTWMAITMLTALVIPQTLPAEGCLFLVSCIVMCCWAIQLIPTTMLPRWMKFRIHSAN
jgi:O-antigen/teichoic acid export membrane protein